MKCNKSCWSEFLVKVNLNVSINFSIVPNPCPLLSKNVTPIKGVPPYEKPLNSQPLQYSSITLLHCIMTYKQAQIYFCICRWHYSVSIYSVMFCYYTGGCFLCLIHVNCTSILGMLADIKSLGGTRLFKILQVMQEPVKGNLFNFALIFCLFTAIFSLIWC